MNYAQAIAHLYGLGPELVSAAPVAGDTAPAPRRKFDLDHMRTLMTELGDPQTRVPAVLIAGTNGKGSTAATLAAILTAAGYRTGLYTSPHLVRVNERIQLARPVLPSEYGSASTRGADGELQLTPIADQDYAHLYTVVDNACDRLVDEGRLPVTPSFFERLTAVAFLYFAGADVAADEQPQPRADIMVLEVGLGGRLDATNIVEPLLSVITDIALDHQDYLGDTIAEITAEKCGILRQDGILITLPQLAEANEAIGRVAMQLNVHGISAATYVPPPLRAGEVAQAADGRLPRNRYTVRINDSVEPGELQVDSPLGGTHQQRNIALALAAAIALRDQNGYKPPTFGRDRNQYGYKITNAALQAGIRNTAWPGRLEYLEPGLLLDVAHNPAGAWTLRAALSALPARQPRTLLFSCLRDKDLAEMAKILFPLFDSSAGGDPDRRQDHILLAPIASPRAASVEDLARTAKDLDVPAVVVPDLAEALSRARELTPPDGLIVATGSVYLIGELRQLVLEQADSLTGITR